METISREKDRKILTKILRISRFTHVSSTGCCQHGTLPGRALVRAGRAWLDLPLVLFSERRMDTDTHYFMALTKGEASLGRW